jgi:hypothetical protein
MLLLFELFRHRVVFVPRHQALEEYAEFLPPEGNPLLMFDTRQTHGISTISKGLEPEQIVPCCVQKTVEDGRRYEPGIARKHLRGSLELVPAAGSETACKAAWSRPTHRDAQTQST